MIQVSRLSLQLGSFSLRDVSLQVPSGEYAVMMGKTGTGKTSILEAICGLRPIQSGQVYLDGMEVSKLRPSQRGIGYVPQDGALFSSMTVREHLEFALRIRKWPRSEMRSQTDALSELLEIRHLLDRRPHGLSGGEVQRVALGRALAFRPRFLLLDEPLSALDEATRGHMYEVLLRVREHADATALHVTHSRSEARRLADRVFVIEAGQVREETSDSAAAVAQQEPAS